MTKEKGWFRRHKVLTGLFIVVGLIILLGIFAGLGGDSSTDSSSDDSFAELDSDSSADNQIEEHEIGERVVWGDFAYTLHGVETESEIGSYLFDEFYGEKADGIFLVVDVTIENIGQETEYFLFDLIQIIDNQERIFDNDGMAEIYLEEEEGFGMEQLQPGLPRRGKMVFDVPQDIEGKIRLSDGIFSPKYTYVLWA